MPDGAPSSRAPSHELVLTTAARSLRRALGPTAWVVLEELTSRGSREAETDVVVVATNVRDLADSLGLGRDAVASALQALALAGWVRCEAERGSGGRFGAGRYRVSTSSALRRAREATTPRPGDATVSVTTRPRQRDQQLSLLDLSTITTKADNTATDDPLSSATNNATDTATNR